MPIGKFDGDVGPTQDPAVHPLPPNPIDGPKVPEAEPDIEPLHGSNQGMLVPINPDEFDHVLELAKLDMAKRLGLADTDSISLRKISAVNWGNTSLGNPQPGVMYAQVIVPGFTMLLEADGAFSVYNTSLDEMVFVDGPEGSRFRRRVWGSRRGRPCADSPGGRGGPGRRGSPGRPRHRATD